MNNNSAGSTRSDLVELDQELLNQIRYIEREQRTRGNEIDPSIPWERATFSWETRKCGKRNCKCKFGDKFKHGYYLIMVWKELGKIKKKYLGKNKDMNIDQVLSDLSYKKKCEGAGIINRDCTFAHLNKVAAIIEAARNDNELAKEYSLKLKYSQVTTDYAYRKVFNK